MDTAPTFAGGARDFAKRYDVAVIGAGFTGLAAARTLAKAGKRVAVLEARKIGNGASGRNGGHVNNGLAHNYAQAMKKHGAEGAKRLYQAYDASVDLIEALVEEEGIACDFRRSGKLKIASKPSHVAGLKAQCALIKREADPQVAFLDREDLTSEIASDEAYAGMLYPKSAMMHVGRYLVGLAEASMRHGADLFEATPMQGRRYADGVWHLETPIGALCTKELLIATGAYSAKFGDPFPEFRRRIVPVGSFVLATRPLTDGEIARTVPGHRTYVTSLNIGNYFRLCPDNRLIFGGRARFSARSDPESDQISGQILRRSLERMFPHLKGIQADYCFGGLVDMTRDRLPRSGQMEGLWFAMGYSGSGAQLSTFLGTKIADCILHRGDNPLGFLDWPAIPGHMGKPWFLPATGLYFRLKDWLS